MKLLLIRHGETVDNVASIWAGTRDSPLTAHGVLQARRLSSHLSSRSICAVFSSDLQRASITAQYICEDQKSINGVDVPHTRLTDLRERDFGPLEGLSFRAREAALYDENAVAETKEAMTIRANRFLQMHLFPLASTATDNDTCVVVAHGIFLGVLYRALCATVRTGGLTFNPAAFPNGNPTSSLPPWRNTGYLECVLHIENGMPSLRIELVNCQVHLDGLKRTRGGIGSSAFDAKQKTVDSFFKPKST